MNGREAGGQTSDDVGGPSVCCECILLPLVNKEAPLTYSRDEYNKAENSSRDRRRKTVESGRCQPVAKETRHVENEVTPWLHGNT